MKKIVHSVVFRRIIVLSAISVLCLSGYASPQLKRSRANPKAVSVSMVALIATPVKFDGMLVRTLGFLRIEFEGDALYLHEEDYRHGILENSFALRLSESQRAQFKGADLKYVLIEGRVYAKGPESHDMWSGAIGDITRLEVWRADRRSESQQR